jgi:hypothetical protein
MDQRVLYNKLKKEIKSDYGICGLLGNLRIESGYRGNNLQNSYNKKLNLTDEEYTAKVDNGSYTNFVHDHAGYGLVQWTFWDRKQNLYNFAKSEKKSIGDENMQVSFLLKEIKAYKHVWNVINSTTSIKEAAEVVMLEYEKPGDTSPENVAHRVAEAELVYKELFGGGEKIQNGSSLVDLTVLSPYHSGKRTHVVDRITPHCYVGQVSVERIGRGFQNRPAGKEASCNYGIGTDGRVILVVEEENRSWCSSSNANDQRAITIECASDATSPNAFNDAVYSKLIQMCVDICKRYNKKKLLWIEDKTTALAYNPKSDEMLLTVHRWFLPTKKCPGDWMYSRMGDLASKVTSLLNGGVTPVKPFEPYKVKVTIDNLNIRTGPGTNYPSIGRSTGKGVFTIVEESSGDGSKTGWGKLKSGLGWISLDYVTKL